MASVGSVDEAFQAVEAGADIIVAQGWEAGGHVRGTTATLPLVPQVVDAVSPVPVVAAGGIADGRGLAAALCLGAQGAWIGTRFLSADEANIHPHYLERVLNASSQDTFLSKVYDGNWPHAPGRVLYNELIAAWDAAGRPEGDARPRFGETIATSPDGYDVFAYDAETMKKDMSGDIEAGPLWAGQSVGLVNRTEPAATIVANIADEARRALSLTE
jgi:NAD(P)H-dependent flavin oxidoreductase YrpB (nitropropane dioxygenase family)